MAIFNPDERLPSSATLQITLIYGHYKQGPNRSSNSKAFHKYPILILNVYQWVFWTPLYIGTGYLI